MTTFHTKDATCPNCNATVTVNVLTSTNSFGGRYTDFRQDAAGFQPRMLIMNLCRGCGFAGYTHEFKVQNVLPPAVQEKILKRILPNLPEGKVPVSQIYEIHAQIVSWLEKPSAKIADSYLKAAWCCQDEGDHQRERDYRRLAISYFKDALRDDATDSDNIPTITYLIGELYRRTGDLTQAREWYNKVIDRARRDAQWETIGDLAERQRDNPSDKL